MRSQEALSIVPAATYPVTIGGGGHSNWSYSHGGNYGTPSFPAPTPYPDAKANDGPKDGDNSVWNGYTGVGGGSGGTEFGPSGYSNNPTGPHGNAGGCGGGGARYSGNGPGVAQIKFKHHNRKVQMEQIMEKMVVMPLEETMLEVAVEASDKMDKHQQLIPLLQDLLQEEVMG